MKTADLHIHSSFSDSSLSCEDIFAKARKFRLDCISIVDHDCLSAYVEEDIELLSKKYSLEVIKGIEFSTQYKDQEIHLLGYFPNGTINKEFLELLKKLKQDRWTRILKMIEKLSSLEINLDVEEFKDFVKDATLSRLHLASFLKEKNMVRNVKEAFSKYIGVGKPAYMGRFRFNLPEAIEILKGNKALVFLAHPFNNNIEKNIENYVQFGIDGVEVFYPSYSDEKISRYQRVFEERGLLISGGSDSHGIYRTYADIGSVKLPYEYVKKIKNAFR